MQGLIRFKTIKFIYENIAIHHSFSRICTKENCIPTKIQATTKPTTHSSTTLTMTQSNTESPTESSSSPTSFTVDTTASPTSFTVDTMATTATSSASRDIGLIGSAVSYIKSVFSSINRIGTGGIPPEDVVTKDFTYAMQSDEVRSRIPKSVWVECAEIANANYNQGLGYTTPLSVYNRSKC